MPPIKPWLLKPKTSLGIFSGLGEMLDKRQQRQDAAEAKQVALEDRLRESTRQGMQDVRDQEMYELNKQTLEERLKQMKAPPLAKHNRSYDPKRGKIIDLDTGTATDLGFTPEPEPTRNIDPLSQEGITAAAARAAAVAKAEQAAKPSGLGALPPAQANKVKLEQTSILNLQKALRNLDDAVAKHGLEVLPGKGRAAMDALMKEAQIQYKEAANLGVLNGPDLTLIESALGNATSPTQFMRGGAAGVRESLKAAQQALRGRARTMEQVYGVPMPADFYADGAAPGGGVIAKYGLTPPPARKP